MFFIQYKYKNGHKHLFCPIDNQSVSFQGNKVKLQLADYQLTAIFFY